VVLWFVTHCFLVGGYQRQYQIATCQIAQLAVDYQSAIALSKDKAFDIKDRI
jgi:hypothetical protein